jgi:hypothetical protein
MKTWMRHLLIDTKGLSLIGTLTSLGLVGALTLVVLKLSNQGNRITRSLTSENNILEFKNKVSRLLSDEETCSYMISQNGSNNTIQLGQPINTIYKKIIDTSGNNTTTYAIAYQIDTSYNNGSFEIQQMYLNDTGEQNEVQLVIDLNMGQSHLGGKTKQRKIPILVERHSQNNQLITKCKSDGLGYGAPIFDQDELQLGDIIQNIFNTNIGGETSLSEQINSYYGTDYTEAQVRCGLSGGIYDPDEDLCQDNDLEPYDCKWSGNAGHNNKVFVQGDRYVWRYHLLLEGESEKSRPLLIQKNTNFVHIYRSQNGFGAADIYSCKLRNRKGNEVKIQNCTDPSLNMVQTTQARVPIRKACSKKTQIMAGFKWYSTKDGHLGYGFEYGHDYVAAHPSQEDNGDQRVGVGANCCEYIDQVTNQKAKVKNCHWTTKQYIHPKSSTPHNIYEQYCPKDYHITGVKLNTHGYANYGNDRFYLQIGVTDENTPRSHMFAKDGKFELSIQCCQIHF